MQSIIIIIIIIVIITINVTTIIYHLINVCLVGNLVMRIWLFNVWLDWLIEVCFTATRLNKA